MDGMRDRVWTKQGFNVLVRERNMHECYGHGFGTVKFKWGCSELDEAWA